MVYGDVLIGYLCLSDESIMNQKCIPLGTNFVYYPITNIKIFSSDQVPEVYYIL